MTTELELYHYFGSDQHVANMAKAETQNIILIQTNIEAYYDVCLLAQKGGSTVRVKRALLNALLNDHKCLLAAVTRLGGKVTAPSPKPLSKSRQRL
ncbi:MAG TPA: hypothetical protein VFR24_27680 [Candidatus Angelobacter sp.]|nr:hypothetical protein [Candidatus Angelobacter sp.]